MRGTDEPFSTGEVDVGYVSAPSFFCSRTLEDLPVELAGATGETERASEGITQASSDGRRLAGPGSGHWAATRPSPLSATNAGL